MTSLSVVIPTMNAEETLQATLESALWANEVIVVDSGSKDKTLEIAKKYCENVIKIKKTKQDANINKQAGMEATTCDWVLFLDADEIVTTDLRREIEELMLADSIPCDGYMLRRKNLFNGKWLKHGGWWGYAGYVALVRRGKGIWTAVMHTSMKVDGSIGKLKNPSIHNTHRGISQWIRKADEYTTVEASEQRGTSWIYLMFAPCLTFLRNYILWGGWLDGKEGFIAAQEAANYVLYRSVKIWEKNHVG